MDSQLPSLLLPLSLDLPLLCLTVRGYELRININLGESM